MWLEAEAGVEAEKKTQGARGAVARAVATETEYHCNARRSWLQMKSLFVTGLLTHTPIIQADVKNNRVSLRSALWRSRSRVQVSKTARSRSQMLKMARSRSRSRQDKNMTSRSLARSRSRLRPQLWLVECSIILDTGCPTVMYPFESLIKYYFLSVMWFLLYV